MGDRLGGDRFEVVRELGRGGMGIVYEAIDHRDGARVALKTLRNISAQAVYRLKQEFRALQDIEHPNLVSLRDLAEHDGQWFFTMELVPGTGFLAHVRNHDETVVATADTADGPLSGFDVARLRRALRGLATGVAALHDSGKIHRDIKPSNIRVTPQGRIVLLDFGLVADAIDPGLSGEGDVVGTPAYMAPEQAASRPVGPEADWYSVGAVLYEALTGATPFTGTALQMAMDKQHREPPPPASLVPSVPADLNALCVALLRIDADRRPGAAEVLDRVGAGKLAAGSVSHRTRTSELYGRESELARMDRALAEVRSGTSATVHITGESGVGKSALTEHFVAEIAARDPTCVVLRGRCYEREWVPYKGLDGVVDSLSRHLRSLSDAEQNAVLPRNASLLPRVFRVLARVDAIAQAPPFRGDLTDVQEMRRRAFAALREMLSLLAERATVIIAIDDLQWADGDSLLLLDELLRPPEAPPVLLIGNSRQPVQSAGHGRWLIELRPLEPDAARQLARALLAREGLSGTVSPTMIAAEARGHPLYVDELVRFAATSAQRSPDGAALKLDDAIRARVELLPPLARQVIQLAAVAGTPLPSDTLCAASRAAPRDLTRALSVLRAGSLLRTRRDGAADIVEPYHDRVREAITDGLDTEALTDCHRRIAGALEHTPAAAERPEVMVPHLAAAGDRARAAEYARRAAERAAAALAFDRAAAHYETAVTLSEEDATPELRVARAEAVARAGRGVEAADLFLREYGGGDEPEQLRHLAAAVKHLFKSGHFDRGFQLVDEVCSAAGIRFPATPRGAMVSLTWQRCKLAIRGLGWRERSSSNVAPGELARVDLLAGLAVGLGTQDTLRAADLTARWLLRALRLGESRRAVHALAMFHALDGTRSIAAMNRAQRYFDRTLRPRAVAMDDAFCLAYIDGIVAMFDFYRGRFTSSITRLRQTERVMLTEAPDALYEVSAIRFFEVASLRLGGRLRALGERSGAYLSDAILQRDRYVESTVRLLSNMQWLARDDLDGDAENFERGRWPEDLPHYHLPHGYAIQVLAERALYAGAVADSAEDLERRIAAYRRSLIGRVVFVNRLEIDWVTARLSLALAARGIDEARHRARAAALARRHVKSGFDYHFVWALLTRAAIEHQTGGTERCVALLRDAADTDRGAETPHLRAAARRRLGQLLGGDEGAELIRQCDEWMASEGVVAPARFTEMLSPGFGTYS